MNDTSYQILKVLSSGGFCSGNDLAIQFGISRTAIKKHVQVLIDYGLDIYALPGRGYKLSHPLQLLDENIISSRFKSEPESLIKDVLLLPSIGSTNKHLLALANDGEVDGCALLAEHQSQGRGRRGKEWLSPFGQNLYCSLLWRFDGVEHGLGALSLAVGIAVVDAIESLGISGVQLKWPNDLLHNGRKLAGILLEMSGDPNGSGFVVIGIGINVDMRNDDESEKIGQPWIDLCSLADSTVCRNALTIALLSRLSDMLKLYDADGFSDLVNRWNELDYMYGKEVNIIGVNYTQRGTAQGIDENGALLLLKDKIICRIHSGEVSLRLAEK